jgi:hypothetical protein
MSERQPWDVLTPDNHVRFTHAVARLLAWPHCPSPLKTLPSDSDLFDQQGRRNFFR